ncbi:cullin-associated NEDD8-dissociated protein 2 isoform X4 [Erinaceus europaeus]|uniref:Cullin-associated NEDD8-dissociated protein 2 isoform X4 n=1 Tax=Erinaceus europaeus TaxID=9365 RepID=A0ABM3WJB4_ERIEU|nr:cullin-associated NEDD8-dissociated protein 2 isoform X4 [Erinaceus europaeus]
MVATMSGAALPMSSLLEKMTSSDKDFRFMATSDLLSELQKDSIQLDEDSERRVVQTLLGLLEDRNGEVQGLAVRCLGPLVGKVKECQVEAIVEALCANMRSDKEQLRDIAGIGLKTVLSKLPPAATESSLATSVCRKVTGQLTAAIIQQEDVALQLEALDILSDMLSRLGAPLGAFHAGLLHCLLPQLGSPRLAVRKRAVGALGHLAAACCSDLLTQLADHLLQRLPSPREPACPTCPAAARTLVQCVGSVGRQAGHRLESEDGYSDEEDQSWKVRRAAARCLGALPCSRPDLQAELLCSLGPPLIHRFREREETVRAEVFATYSELLHLARAPGGWPETQEEAGEQGSFRHLLRGQVPLVVKALQRQLKDHNPRVRQACFSLLGELEAALPGSLEEHTPMLVTGLVFSLGERSGPSAVRLDALALLQQLIGTEPVATFASHLPTLLPALEGCVADPCCRLAAEGLRALQELVRVLWPLDGPGALDPQPHVARVAAACLSRLRAVDLDQEVKERVLACTGHLLAHLGDRLAGAEVLLLGLLLERLQGEATRLPATRALALAAASPLLLDLRPLLAEALPLLAGFMRRGPRALRLAALQVLEALARTRGPSLPSPALQPVLAELPTLLGDGDMPAAQLALELLAALAQAQPACLAEVSGPVLDALLGLLCWPLLPAGVLAAAEALLQALAGGRPPCVDYARLTRLLMAPVIQAPAAGRPGPPKQALHSLARCLATLAAACPQEAAATAQRLVAEARCPDSSPHIQVLALLTLAELGAVAGPGPQRELKAALLDALGSASEDVRAAASLALGRVGAGSLADFLALLPAQLRAEPRHQYLLLGALREALGMAVPDSLRPHLEVVWALLLPLCQVDEEGTRGLVAECLARLVLANPPFLLPRLRMQLAADQPLTRSTAIMTVKFLISDQPHPVDPQLKTIMGDFLESLRDPDSGVRRAALALLNSAVHNKPSLVRGELGTVLPLLYQETRVRRELIREVEMGPFKHTVDEGLDLRKAAFECMYSLLERCLAQLELGEFLSRVEDGLKDHPDIRMSTFTMLARLAALCPASVLQRVDRLMEPLRATCLAKVKADSVKQEFEKQEELRHSAMRAVAALLSIPEVGKSPIMADFLSQIQSNPELKVLFESTQKDSASGRSTDTTELS